MSAAPPPTVHPGGCCEQPRRHRPRVLPPPGRQPSAVPAAAPAGVFLALVLWGAGIVALRDTAVALQWLHGTPWIDAVIDRIDGMSFAWWVIPADHKWVTRALVSGVIAHRIEDLGLKRPAITREQQQALAGARKQLTGNGSRPRRKA